MINLTVFINGIDRTNMILQSSISITEVLYSTPDILRFTVQSYLNQPYAPEINDKVEVFDGVELIYGGVVMQADKSVDLAHRITDIDVSCVDYGQLLDRKLIIERLENTSVHQIVAYLIGTYALDFTVSLPGEDFPVTSITFNNITISKAFDKLAKLSNYSWYADYDKTVYFFKALEHQAPFDITDKNGKYIPDTLVVSEDLSQMTNRITVKGGEIPVNEVTLNFKGAQGVLENDGALTLDTVQKFSTKPIVTRNTLPVNVGTVGIDSEYTGIWDAMWSFQEKYLKFDIYVAPDDNITMTGTPLEVIQVRIQDSPSIRKYGRWDVTMSVPGIQTREEAVQYANAQKKAYAKPVYTIKFSTYTKGLVSGQTLNVKSTQFDVDETFFIQNVRMSLLTQSEAIWSVTASTVREITLLDILAQIVGMKELEEMSTEGLETLIDIPFDAFSISDQMTDLSTKTGPYQVWPAVGDGTGAPIVVNFSTMGLAL